MLLVDSHCHLDLLQPHEDVDMQFVDEVVTRAQKNDVGAMINVCVTLNDYPTILKTAQRYTNVWTSVGEHPNENPQQILNVPLLTEYAKNAKVIAIGETGLDYYRSAGDLKWQQDRFIQHIAIAKEIKKPLIVHTRAAKEDTISILANEDGAQCGGVMHCFTEDWDMAKKALDMGFYISFSGIVTFKNAKDLQDVAKRVPLERMLIETDAPYLAPNPFRGKPNEPAYVRYTAEYLANLKGITLEQLAETTTNNFFTLFKGAERPHV